jgi:glycosyltransferase involved in cell wall biosynthesis
MTSPDVLLPAQNAPLTVMQVLPRLHVGGVERGTVEFAIFLKQQGHRSIVVSKGGPLVQVLNRAGVEHIQLNVADKSLKTLRTVKQLRDKIVEMSVDVLHVRSRIPAWLCHWALKKVTQRPLLVSTLHGLHSVNRYSSIMARADRVIAVSQTAKEYLQCNFSKYLRKEPVLIYRGVDKQFTYDHQVNPSWLQDISAKHPDFSAVKKVLLPGRLTALKGIEHVIPWLSQAPKQSKLVLTASPGESNYAKKTAQLFASQGLMDQVIWLGTVRQMPDLYAAVDVVISVNKKAESFGRTVLEALSIGKPVVAFDFGGVSEIMNQLFPQGLVKTGDANALSQKITAFLQQAPVVKPHEQFQNTTMFEKTLALYQDELNGVE